MDVRSVGNRRDGWVSVPIIGTLVAAIVLLAAGSVWADTEVSGNVSGTWDKTSSPYIVTSTVTIPAGQTLTIEPGVVVKFNDNLGMTVRGTLNADGTPAEKITFTSSGDLEPDWWRSIQFLDGSFGILDHCIVQYGGYSDDTNIVCWGNASPTISNCEISYSDQEGIRLENDAQPTIEHCTIAHNGDWAIWRRHWNANPHLSDNTFSDNGHNGVYVTTHTIPSGREVTWENPGVPYVIENITVSAGATLNILPGTMVKVLERSYLWVYGTLNAVGTSSEQIRFTAYTDDAVGGDTNGDGSDTVPSGGYWRTLAFDGGMGTLDYCIIRYGGHSERTNVLCRGNTTPTISHSEISYGGENGVRVQADAWPSITHSAIDHNTQWPIHIQNWRGVADLEGTTVANNGQNGILVDSHNIPAGQSVTWSASDVPYVLGHVTIQSGGTLTIPAGSIVKFGVREYITIGAGSTLNAVGTADDPIVFTAFTDDAFGGDTNGDGGNTVPGGGYWNSLFFDNGAQGTLDYCVFRYGGYSNQANIVCRSASPTISHSEIAYSSVYGLKSEGASLPVLIENRIQLNAEWPVYIHALTAIPDFQNNSIRYNAHNGIRLNTGNVAAGQHIRLDRATVPYVTDNLRVLGGGTLEIPAGVILKFINNRSLFVDSGGTLVAKGTEEDRVVLTAYTDDYYGGDTNSDGSASAPSAGYWGPLYFRAASRDTLDYCVVKYGGISQNASVVFEGDASQAKVTYSIIAYSTGAAIRCLSNAQPTVMNCSLSPNAVHGINVEGTSDVDATNNWWGDTTGPYHPVTNSGGGGIEVTDHVLFDPWLGAPAVTEPFMPVPPTVSYTIHLTQGLNLTSLPVKPPIPYTARSLLEELEGTLIIAMEEGTFIPFLPSFSGPGFTIQGGQGYVVNMTSDREVTFWGTPWADPIAKPASSSGPSEAIWAFVIAGRLEEVFRNTDYAVVVKNLRTGSVVWDAGDRLPEGFYAAAWVDLDGREVVRAGDPIEVVLRNPAGDVMAGPWAREVTAEDLAHAVLHLDLTQRALLPNRFALDQNYPNPFNPTTWIPYALPRDAYVVIRIYDTLGRVVRTLDLGPQRAGVYGDQARAAFWDGKDVRGRPLGNGVYFYSIQAGTFSATRKMLMIK